MNPRAFLFFGPGNQSVAVLGGQILIDPACHVELVLRGQQLDLSGCLYCLGFSSVDPGGLSAGDPFTFQLLPGPCRPNPSTPAQGKLPYTPGWIGATSIAIPGALVGNLLTIQNPSMGNKGLVSVPPNVAWRWSNPSMSDLSLVPASMIPGAKV